MTNNERFHSAIQFLSQEFSATVLHRRVGARDERWRYY
jgi:hypothetical protein